MSWLKNLKNKKYPFWRLDTLFSKSRYINLEIINDGGWHFTNLMTAEKLYEKLEWTKNKQVSNSDIVYSKQPPVVFNKYI